MQWTDALNEVSVLDSAGSAGEILSVEYDSRRVRQGSAFVAMRGGTTDGNRYVDSAITQGAVAIVTDSKDTFARVSREHHEIAVARVDHGRRALAELSAAVLGHPERKLAISAVTGTNGKTTTAYLLEQMLRSAGRKCVLIGTIETHIGDQVRPSEHTTPEASDLLKIFADGLAVGATEVVMEISSHALDQERVWGIPVDVAIFTNLTQDHLDYHGTMERYAAAKTRLFEGVGGAAPRVALINWNDSASGRMIGAAAECRQISTYGIGPSVPEIDATDTHGEHADYQARHVLLSATGTSFELETPYGAFDVESRLVGIVNVHNLIAAMAAAVARGMTIEEAVKSAATLKAVSGRFETIENALGITIVVDYAHTDDALRNLILLARQLVGPGPGRVITLFGCGGDRDRTKRPRMGRVAGEGSDLVVLTSDNPRSEEPMAIIAEALAGVRETATECIVEPDRSAAIELAIRAAHAGDIVLIAGKGHEKVQVLGDRTVPFDDVAVATNILQELR